MQKTKDFQSTKKKKVERHNKSNEEKGNVCLEKQHSVYIKFHINISDFVNFVNQKHPVDFRVLKMCEYFQHLARKDCYHKIALPS